MLRKNQCRGGVSHFLQTFAPLKLYDYVLGNFCQKRKKRYMYIFLGQIKNSRKLWYFSIHIILVFIFAKWQANPLTFDSQKGCCRWSCFGKIQYGDKSQNIFVQAYVTMVTVWDIWSLTLPKIVWTWGWRGRL